MKAKIFFAFAVACLNVAAQHLTGYVDPRIGTGDHGHVFMGANVPFGMVQAGPTQLQHGWDWCSGYHYSSDSIIGFSHLHLSGTGCGDLGDVALMPFVGRTDCSRKGLARKFTHADEVSRPGYYSVKLPTDSINVELTATERVALHRYTFLGRRGGRSVCVDLENTVSTWDKTTDCRLQRVDSCTFVGYRMSSGWAKQQSVYFAMRFSREITDVEMRKGVREGAKGMQYAMFRWNERGGQDTLMVKVALSPVSEANALLNMETEMNGWDFDDVRQHADEAWERELQRVEATFPTQREARIFYTSMFHLMVAPQLWCDVNGDYMGVDLRIHRNAGYNHLTTWSLWDTYRTAHPLSTIIFSDRSRDYIHTFMDIYRQSGELPVWHLVSNDTYCMVGEPAVPVAADLILKHQNADVDAEEIYQAIKSSLIPRGVDESYPLRGKQYLSTLGYLPYDGSESESVAKSLEYFLACWSASEVAGRLGHSADSVMFARLSKNYAKLYDERVGFIRALSSDGKFRDLTGFNPCHQTKDYTEGNAWQYTFLVPHDVDGLVQLMGGRKAFERKLDSLFVADADLGAEAAPDVSGLIGQYAHGNEPSHHILYMYNYVGRPDKAQKLLRRVMDTLYDDAPAGLCGNEDVGQMSAWYIMSALGFYQVEPSGGRYQLGCPIVRKARINVGGGRTFVVETVGNPSKGRVRKWILNGKMLNRTYITHDEVMRAGELKALF